MSIYRVNPIGGGSGFKVHVTDQAGGLRVVGVFLTETDANAWIATDSRITRLSGNEAPHLLTRQEQKSPTA
jgi:hypothetical protein